MSAIDQKQINKNRRVMADSTIESPYVVAMDDTENDIPEHLYDQVPKDKVGFLPKNTEE